MTSRIHHYEIRQSLLVMSLVMLLTGCQRGLPGQYPPLPGEGGGGVTGTDTIGDNPTAADDPAAWIFTLDRVHRVQIELPSDSWNELARWPDYFTWDLPYDYVVGDVTIDGEILEDVGVRLKGQWGSYRPLSGKPSLKVDVNRYQDQDFHGLKKLTFNNMIYDYSGVEEHMAYLLFNAMGIPCPRTAYAWVTINDEVYGLYNWIETYDGVFTDDRLGGGNLYDADYVVYADYSYTLVDFEPYSDAYFELQGGEDVDLADVRAVTEALGAWSGTPDFQQQTRSLIDWAHHRRYMAVEAWIGHTDGYTYNSNNYYAWFEPEGARLRLLPWDMHYTFMSTIPAWTAAGQLSSGCLSSADCTEELMAEFQETWGAMDALQLSAELELAYALIDEPYHEDPRRETPFGWIDYYQQAMHTWVEDRTHALMRTWGL